MKKDEGLDAIREVRAKISAAFDHDPDRLIAYYLEQQKKYAARLVQTDRDRRKKAEGA